MAKLQDELLGQLQKKFRQLRSVSDYDAYLMALACSLGLPDSTSPIAMKALLIRATKETFPNTINADMVLAALGLLQGYNNQYGAETEIAAKKRLTERRIKFLQKSSYKPTDAISDDTREKVLSTLGRTDGRNIDKVVQTLYEKPNLKAYLQESVEEYGVFDQGRLVDVTLPALKFAAKQVERHDLKDDTTYHPSPDPTSDIPVKDTHPALLLWSRGLLAVCIALIACLTLSIVYLIYSNRARPISETAALDGLEVQSIAFLELSELRVLAPGESIVLSVEIDPDKIGPEELDYTSDQPEVAYTDKNAVTALPNLPSSIDEVVTITAQKGVVEDKTYIHVLGTDSAGIGHGTNATGDGTEGGE